MNKKFIELMDASGKTRYQISKQTGIAQSSLKRLEDGASSIQNMTLTNAVKLAKALRVSVDVLLSASDNEYEIIEGKDGWVEINPDLSILVEDGVVVRGVMQRGVDQNTVYPYEKVEDGWDKRESLSVEEFVKLVSEGKARML